MTTLLFDADITVFRSAQSQEVATETRDGYWTWHCEFKNVLEDFDKRLEFYKEVFNTDKYILFLSDEYNFRKDLYPEYKILRQKKKRPLVLKPFKKFLIEERGAIVLPNLEGDDCCGIYATNGSIDDEIVVISDDKDLKTIPSYLYRENEVKWYSEEDANYWHLYQTLVGDTTDGYPGCPGIGPKKAETVLSKDPTWGTVVKVFVEAGLTEDDALVQARCARILRSSDWDAENQKVKLWTPT